MPKSSGNLTSKAQVHAQIGEFSAEGFTLASTINPPAGQTGKNAA
jgi:hypothetical protein